jgi:hypothetical protein
VCWNSAVSELVAQLMECEVMSCAQEYPRSVPDWLAAVVKVQLLTARIEISHDDVEHLTSEAGLAL